MRRFYRKPNIYKLALQLEAVEDGLQALLNAEGQVPSPREAEAVVALCKRLKTLPALAANLEVECWRRVDKYINTPYTPMQLFYRRVAAFFGWWFAATITLTYSAFSWFVSWFPQPWHMFATSAAAAFIFVVWGYFKEQDH